MWRDGSSSIPVWQTGLIGSHTLTGDDGGKSWKREKNGAEMLTWQMLSSVKVFWFFWGVKLLLFITRNIIYCERDDTMAKIKRLRRKVTCLFSEFCEEKKWE